jgi:hypothetical protein
MLCLAHKIWDTLAAWAAVIFGGGWAGRTSLRRSRSSFRSGSGVGVAREVELPAIAGRDTHVDHLHGGELLQHAARAQSRDEILGAVTERHVQAVGKEGDHDVRLDAVLALMVDRADRQIALERFERLLDGDPRPNSAL